ncbi:alpha/beta hydrolase family protein [Fimbriimonas ginsengisoli]|uniref:Peptidase S9 prolyl oligopeptidase catalytic domain-containing protein n=1 Tax=Fimbriimonas ginsengisoli Gsoil 348 TaxID=661478 RepID=A0A068NXG8_FIMGI|nr:prolyl oligopeptidase family serine peptidase [Fimbriimonas ginsengisoli]AIE88027.1 hypothetical protein OP10G_4659 [Fimbriimonas ginsengisoli Gsoil 348]
MLATIGCGRFSRGNRTSTLPAPAKTIASGVRFQEIRVSKFKERPRLWVYAPDDKKKNHPCIVIAAAGSPMTSGMPLGEGDRAEHLPYVAKGYVVVAYEVSGPLVKGADPIPAMTLFAKRDLGIANGKAAIDYALHSLPVDPMRLYAVGHSSAATLALQLSAADSRIRGCVAYAPVTDVPDFIGPDRMALIGNRIPQLATAIRKLSPKANIGALRCPVMLFTAADDQTVPTESVQSYAEALKQKNSDVDLVRVSSGDHYDSMIQEGIPAGIQWLGRARRPKK